jgi:hypothetical protein
MSEEFLARQSGFLALMQRNRQRLLTDELRRREEELDECVHQPLITKMAARLQKESVVETTEKFLQRKQERIDLMRRELEQKELDLIKSPQISESSRFLAVKRAEKLCSDGVLRPSSSPGQRLYALAQHSSRKKMNAIEEEAVLKKSVPVKVRPESELVEACTRLYLEAEKRKARLEETRSAYLNAEENALKQLSWTNTDYSSIRLQASRDSANFTLISPFCKERDDAASKGSAELTSKDSQRVTATPASVDAEIEEGTPVISDMSRLIVEQLERRSGVSSSERLRMPLEKDRVSANSTPVDQSRSSPRNGSTNSSHHNSDIINAKFEKWREQQLSRHIAKQAKLEEFRRQQEQQLTKSRQIMTALQSSDDLFYRKQLDKQMRHEPILECARAAKEKQEAENIISQKSKPVTGTAAPIPNAATRLLQSTAAHEARVAARFKGDA